MVGLPMMEIDLNNNVINKESLKESFMEKYGVNDLEGLYEWIENYEIYSDKGGKTFMSKVTNLINELSNTGYNELKELENDIKEKHMGDEPLSNEELK
jgi:hypothetical protein